MLQKINRWAGTSIGAVMALMGAVNCSNDQMLEFVNRNMNREKLLGMNFECKSYIQYINVLYTV